MARETIYSTLREKLESDMKSASINFWLKVFAAILLVYILELTNVAEFFAPHAKFIEELLRDIRIALQVSFVIFLLERRIRKIHLEQIQANVLQAALSIALPKALANELIMIIKEPIYRHDLRYHVTILPFRPKTREEPYTKTLGDPEEYLVLQREISYSLKNMTAHSQEYEVKSISDNKYGIPVEKDDVCIKINKKKVRLMSNCSSEKESAWTALVRWLLQVGGPPRLPSRNLQVQEKKIESCHKIKIPPRGTREVYIKSQEILRVGERNSIFTFLWPSVNLYLILSNAFPDRIESMKAELNHRPKAELIPELENTYIFKGGLLPGQSFEVSWEPRPGPDENL